MIVQKTAGGLRLFRQTDHALLAAAFARAWGSEAVPDFAVRHHVECAAARHDDGWAEWELTPTIGEDGAPVDFIRLPVSEHAPLYRRGIDLVEREHPYQGLIVSLHGERLYTRPFSPGTDPRIDRLTGRDLEIAEDYVAFERQRQAILADRSVEELGGPLATGDLAASAEEAWRLLQVWDRISLFVCMQELGSGASYQLPPVTGHGGEELHMVVSTPRPGEIAVNPYPFSEDGATFQIPAVRTTTQTWPDNASYRRDVRTSPRELVTFTCRPA